MAFRPVPRFFAPGVACFDTTLSCVGNRVGAVQSFRADHAQFIDPLQDGVVSRSIDVNLFSFASNSWQLAEDSFSILTFAAMICRSLPDQLLIASWAR